jgi:hypothetical protein
MKMSSQNDPDKPLDMDQFKEALAFDPFAPASTTGSQGDDGLEDDDQGQDDDQGTDQGQDEGQDSLEGGDGGQQAPKPKTPSAPGADPDKQAPSGGDDKDKTIEGLRAQIAKMLESPAPKPQETPAKPAAPSAQPQGSQGQEVENPYNIRVNANLVEGLNSDNPEQQQAAISAVANAVMNKMFQDFSQALHALEQRIMNSIPTVMTETQTVQTQQQLVAKDMFDNFPELDKPLLHKAVWDTVASIAERTGVKEWNAELRDTAGAVLLQQLGLPRQGPRQQQQQQPAAQPSGGTGRKPRKTFAAGSGNNGTGRSGDQGANEFLDVLQANGGF